MNKVGEQTLTRIVSSAIELEEHLHCWEDLAKNSAEPNIFYEPGPLLAALKNIDNSLPFICLLVFYKKSTDQNIEEQLIGLFPFQKIKKVNCINPEMYQSFTHRHCYLSTPLVHKSYISVALNCFFSWINSAPNGIKLFRLHRMNGTGILAEAFQHQIKQPMIRRDRYQRAFLSLTGNAEEYINNSLSKHKRKEYGRLRRRLEEQGNLRLETVRDDQQHQWLDRFLFLEASGWKGQNGHAMDNNSNDSGFFYDLIQSLSKEQRLILHTLWIDDHIIAMKCNLIASDNQSSFAYKITYDENYSQFSPGVLLELENIHDLFNQKAPLLWADSCANPDHPMIDHLWRERRTIDDYIFGCRSLSGYMMILFQKIHKRFAKKGDKHNNAQ